MLNNEVIEFAKENGCGIIGFADLTKMPYTANLGFKYGIVYALAFSKEAMLENNENKPQRYWDEHAPMSKTLAKLKNYTAELLMKKGYATEANTPAADIEERTLRAALSQKAVATMAGIGWIGKNAMLVTKEAGSAIRLTTVLTNAPIDCGTPITTSKCPVECMACTKICPGKAPSGNNWSVETDRDEFFNAHACYTAGRKRAKELLDIEITCCGLCISACPFTKKALGYK